MIETNRQDYKKDLDEVIYLFCDGENLEIKHSQSTINNKFIDNFILDGKTYNF